MGIYAAKIGMQAGQDLKNIANGEATAKDVTSREMSKFKNFLKSTVKWGVASATVGTAGAVAGLQVLDVIDIKSKLPNFAKNAVEKFLNKDSVKKFAEITGDALEGAYTMLAQGAKSHPIAMVAALGISTIGSIVGLKIAYDLGKGNGKADQKYDDTARRREKNIAHNPRIRTHSLSLYTGIPPDCCRADRSRRSCMARRSSFRRTHRYFRPAKQVRRRSPSCPDTQSGAGQHTLFRCRQDRQAARCPI